MPTAEPTLLPYEAWGLFGVLVNYQGCHDGYSVTFRGCYKSCSQDFYRAYRVRSLEVWGFYGGAVGNLGLRAFVI